MARSCAGPPQARRAWQAARNQAAGAAELAPPVVSKINKSNVVVDVEAAAALITSGACIGPLVGRRPQAARRSRRARERGVRVRAN